MTIPLDVTGQPVGTWLGSLAREMIAQLREMPAAAAGSEVEQRLLDILVVLFSELRNPEIATQYLSGNGDIAVYCRNVVFEAKHQGKKYDDRTKLDSSIETPEEQGIRYLNDLTVSSDQFRSVLAFFQFYDISEKVKTAKSRRSPVRDHNSGQRVSSRPPFLPKPRTAATPPR